MTQQLTTTDQRTADRVSPERVPWISVAVFVVIAYGLMWAATIPFWLSPRGLGMPNAQLILIVVMFAPALASLAACRLVEHRRWLTTVGIRSAGPVRRVLGYLGLAPVLIIVPLLLALVVSVLAGWQQLDLAGLSGVRAAERALPAGLAALPPATYLGLILINTLIQVVTINFVSALGEEAGWRGYLLTRLLPLGRWPALVITGVVWALWHLPLILLGYEYPGAGRGAAVLTFVAFTVCLGVVLGWLRLRSESVLPSAIAHGTLNAVAPLTFLLLVGGRPGRVLLGAPQGVTGIVCFAALAALLALVGWSRRSAATAPVSPVRPPAPTR